MLSTLTRLRWWATIHWRLSGGEWYPFRHVPEEIVRKWASRPAVLQDDVDVVLAARDELEQRGHRWVDAPRSDWEKCIAVETFGADAPPRAWCGRDLQPFEFRFTGIDHAALNGRNQGRLVACSECVRKVVDALNNGQEN